eukprot:9623580-Karenia_brevis.AAC.1
MDWLGLQVLIMQINPNGMTADGIHLSWVIFWILCQWVNGKIEMTAVMLLIHLGQVTAAVA